MRALSRYFYLLVYSILIAVVSPLSVRAQNEEVSEELEEIVVTSTRNRRSFEQQPTRIEVLGGEEINEKANMKPCNGSIHGAKIEDRAEEQKLEAKKRH